MVSTQCGIAAALLLLSRAWAATLLASHYTGGIHTLSLELGADGANASLETTGSTAGCGRLPAWLEWDADTRTVYCVDESWFGSGVVASFNVGADGTLTQTGQTATSGASVHGTLYGGDDGKGFLATTDDPSTLTTYKLPLSPSTAVQQQFKFNLTAPGPHPRQEASHPHSSLPDPTGRFLLVPDLGADLIRVFSIIDAASGELSECGAGQAGAGDGPRHAVFWAPEDAADRQMLYTVNELGNSVSVWTVVYPGEGEEDGCMTLSRTQTLSTFAEGTRPRAGSKAAEVHVRDGFLYAANRADETFGPRQDSIATYAIDADTGAISWIGADSAHAWFPRTFAVNAAGDLVAVGGQTSSNVAILARDPETGRLGDLVADVRVATPGNPQQEDGLSAVIWAE